jgi:hypothetical protein
MIDQIVGRVARVDIDFDNPITWNVI